MERSDFFRYMVLLRHGGVYADIDTECRIPVDDIVSDHDTLVVGWENEWATPAIAFNHHYVRLRQVAAGSWSPQLLLWAVLFCETGPT